MQRTTVMADEEVLRRLRRLALERGVSFAQVVREALREKAETFAPEPTSIGAGSSGSSRSSSTAATDASTRQPPRSWR